jgi:hypothetical protein
MTGLLGSTVLEVAIGIVFIYLLLAIFCTTANEWIAAVFKSRGALLQKALLQMLAPDHPTSEAAAQDPIVTQFFSHPLIKSITRANRLPAYLAPRTFAKTVMHIVTPGQPGSITFEDIENGIKKDLPPGGLQTALLSVLQGSEKTVEGAQAAIEAWYGDHMDRVSGWYKRKTQLWTVIVATLVTVATNADTLHVARRLWLEPALRSQIVESARSQPSAPAAEAKPTGAAASQQAADTLGLVLGWQDAGDLKDGKLWLQRIIGWLMTILAVSLGAPFWFDVLNKFMSIRSSGKSPEEKGKEPRSTTPPANAPANP